MITGVEMKQNIWIAWTFNLPCRVATMGSTMLGTDQSSSSSLTSSIPSYTKFDDQLEAALAEGSTGVAGWEGRSLISDASCASLILCSDDRRKKHQHRENAKSRMFRAAMPSSI